MHLWIGGEDREMKIRVLAKAGIGFSLFLCLEIGLCVDAKDLAAFQKEGQIYLIQSAKDMRTLAQLVNKNEEVEPGVKANTASYRLTRDIDLSAYCTGEGGWEPIGYRNYEDDSLEDILWNKIEESGEGEEYWATYEATDAGYFNGTFDGDGHVITGLYINRPEEQAQGCSGRERICVEKIRTVQNIRAERLRSSKIFMSRIVILRAVRILAASWAVCGTSFSMRAATFS